LQHPSRSGVLVRTIGNKEGSRAARLRFAPVASFFSSFLLGVRPPYKKTFVCGSYRLDTSRKQNPAPGIGGGLLRVPSRLQRDTVDRCRRRTGYPVRIHCKTAEQCKRGILYGGRFRKGVRVYVLPIPCRKGRFFVVGRLCSALSFSPIDIGRGKSPGPCSPVPSPLSCVLRSLY
jgi:hypothetical protein